MLLLLCTALCLRFLFRRADHVPGGVRHVFASPAWPLRPNGLLRRGNERPPCCRVAARAQSHSCAAGPAGQRHPQPDQHTQHTQHTQHLCRQQPGYGPSVPATPVAALVVSPHVTASVVPIAAAVSPDTFAPEPTATATTTPPTALAPHIDAPHIDAPIDAPPHAVPGPSKLWPDALVLVTAAVARALVATFDSNASTRSGAILPAASMVCADGASAAPVHCAALHRGQRQRRFRVALHAACAQPPP